MTVSHFSLVCESALVCEQQAYKLRVQAERPEAKFYDSAKDTSILELHCAKEKHYRAQLIVLDMFAKGDY